MDNIITIAEGLTEAQRALLLTIDTKPHGWAGRGNGQAAAALGRKGLLTEHHRYAYTYQATPLGLAVRSYLQRQST